MTDDVPTQTEFLLERIKRRRRRIFFWTGLSFLVFLVSIGNVIVCRGEYGFNDGYMSGVLMLVSLRLLDRT